MNPLNLPGPQFLKLYMTMFTASVAAALVIRAILRRRVIDRCAASLPSLDPLETAFLVGGPARAIQAAIVSLVQQGCLKVRSASDIRATSDSPRDASPLESAVNDTVQAAGSNSIRQIRARCGTALRAIDDRLVSEGLLLPPALRKLIALVAGGPPLYVLLLGFAKIVVGASRNRPIGILVVLCMALAVVAGVLLMTTPRTTSAGAALVRKLRAGQPVEMSYKLSGPELTLAVALFGPALLTSVRDPELQGMARALRPPGGGGDSYSFGCGSSCGSSCGGGSCGGGGCGGCSGG